MRRLIPLVAVAALGAAGQRAAADATAEDLFRQGRAAIKQDKLGDACRLFAASQAIEPKPGTLLNLGDCLQRLGRTASAHAAFVEAMDLATERGDRRRAREATRRARGLEPQLARLTIAIPADVVVDGFVVRRDGVELDPAWWNIPVPLDPGRHELEVTAPAHRGWSTRIELAAAQQAVVTVPALESDPTAAVEARVPTVAEPARPRPLPVAPTTAVGSIAWPVRRLAIGAYIGGNVERENPVVGGRVVVTSAIPSGHLRGVGSVQYTRYGDEPADPTKMTTTLTAAVGVEYLWTPIPLIGVGGGLGIALDFDRVNMHDPDRQNDVGTSVSLRVTPIVARLARGALELGLQLQVIRAGDEIVAHAVASADWFVW